MSVGQRPACKLMSGCPPDPWDQGLSGPPLPPMWNALCSVVWPSLRREEGQGSFPSPAHRFTCRSPVNPQANRCEPQHRFTCRMMWSRWATDLFAQHICLHVGQGQTDMKTDVNPTSVYMSYDVVLIWRPISSLNTWVYMSYDVVFMWQPISLANTTVYMARSDRSEHRCYPTSVYMLNTMTDM